VPWLDLNVQSTSMLVRHKKTRTVVVLRILKIITPVKCVIPRYDGYIVQPEEGELHRRFRSVKKTAKLDQLVWSLNIDESKSHFTRSLRLLWDVTDCSK
jgi:hypothetical protein